MTTEEVKINVEKALDEIRPFLNSDGGNISLVEIIEDKHVKVRLEGACTSCSLSISTMKAGVETTIKKYVPQIETVENIASYFQPDIYHISDVVNEFTLYA